MALDFDTLYNEASSGAFTGGKKRYYDNRVRNLNLCCDGGKAVISAIVGGADTDHITRIIFDEQGGLYDYSCDCEFISTTDGPCKHVVATALAFEEKNPAASETKASSKTNATTPAALTLISDYAKKKNLRRQTVSESPVRLLPTLCLEDGKVFLMLQIGRDKLYLVRDVSDFASCMQSGALRRYGVDLTLTHCYERFDELSAKLARFVVGCYNEKSALGLSSPAKNLLPLPGGDIDEFFDLYRGQTAAFNDGNVRGGLRLLAPDVNATGAKLIASQQEGGFEFSCSPTAFKTVAGKNYTYMITDTRIFRLDDDFAAFVLPALKIMNTHRNMFVALPDMPLFYNNVVAQVARFISVESGGADLTVYEAAPLVAKLMLNPSEKAGSICAQLVCTYDDNEVDILDDNAPYKGAVRDFEAERIIKNLLLKYFPSFPNLTLDDEYSVYVFLANGIGELVSYLDVYLADELKRMKVKKPPRIKVGVRLSSDLLGLDVEAEDFSAEQLMTVLKAYREKRSYIRLSDGSFVDLNDESLAALSEILEVATIDEGRMTVPKYYAPFINNELKNGFFNLERDREFKAMIQELSAPETLDIEVPESLRSVLRNYQKTGFRWLKTLCKYGFGGILADDMGLGKSLQVIAMLLSQERKKPSIIVCPTTLILNWVGELNKFAPQLKVLPVMGTLEERKQLLTGARDSDVVITSYELIRRDDDLYKTIDFLYAIVDEAQFIKNPETRNARAVKTLNSDYRFALTGTPIENSLAELWSIFDFIMPHYLGSYPRFKETYESEILRGNDSAYTKLKKLVSPFILRRLKSTVLSELPPKVESNVVSGLFGEQKELYDANLALVKKSVAGDSVNKVVVLSMLTKLRQLCCHPSLVYPDYAGNSAKLDTCLELLQSATQSGHKVLLFSQFTSMLDVLRQKLVELDLSHYILKGDTPKTERMRLVNRFNTDDTKVFLISLKAGGTGLNLTGADVVIHYDPWWNESVMNQATDRAYRIGQNRSVQVYKLILKNTVEEKIVKLQEKKSALSSLMVGGENAWTMKDIMEILG